MQLSEQEYEILEDFLTIVQLNSIQREIEANSLPAKTVGVRNAEKKYLSGTPSLVRAILFNKTSKNNWLVAWHQDKTVAVSQKFGNRGWNSWSLKDGVNHSQPPLEVLNQMVTFRIHLDDANRENGCLKVLPHSHKLGLLDQEDIESYVQQVEPVNCETRAGSILVMRPHGIDWA